MLTAVNEDEGCIMPPNRISFKSAKEAETQAAKMADEKRKSALAQDAEFWQIAVEINPNILFFVPDE